jgi:hypothetical protein
MCIKTLFHIQVAEDSKGVAGRAWHTRDTIALASGIQLQLQPQQQQF